MDVVALWQRIRTSWLRARLRCGERGASLVEYALLLALIAVVCFVAITFLGNEAEQKFSEAGSMFS